MEIWSSNAPATQHPESLRVREALAAIGAICRRLAPYLLYALAIVGVPAAAVVLTGGSEAVVFWIVSVVWLVVVTYVAMMVVFIGLLTLSPILLVVSKLGSGSRKDALLSRVSRVIVGMLAVGGFVGTAPLGDTSAVRLPVPWPTVGALIVMTLAAVASYLLWSAGRALRPAKRQRVPTRRHSVPEPEDVYWSDQYAVGWRSWNWDGTSLRGVYARWPAGEFEATCEHCQTVPSWEHVCGVYAAKQPSEVHVFYGWSPIIGRVEMWGDVIEHENGYRASHARITDLWVHDPLRAERIRAAYPSMSVTVGSPSIEQEVA